MARRSRPPEKPPAPPIPPERLRRIRWRDEDAFRVLSHYFSIRWNASRVGEKVRWVLGPFAVPFDVSEYPTPPTPGVPARYSVVDLGRSQPVRFRLLYGAEPLRGSDDLGEVLSHLFWHVNAESFRCTTDFFLIHSGVVATPGGEGVLLPGTSGAGKTTLVAGLVRAGFGYLSDEAAAIDPISRMVYPFQRSLVFKEKHMRLFPEVRLDENGRRPIGGQWHVRANDLRPGASVGSCEVRFVVAYRYEPGASTRIAPMTAPETVMELISNNVNLQTYGGRALPLLADLARGARACRLVSGQLDEAVAALHDLTRRRDRSRRRSGGSSGRAVRSP